MVGTMKWDSLFQDYTSIQKKNFTVYKTKFSNIFKALSDNFRHTKRKQHSVPLHEITQSGEPGTTKPSAGSLPIGCV